MYLLSRFSISEAILRLGVSMQFIKALGDVIRKTFAGTAKILVLSQIIPAKVRLMRVDLPDFVKLPS